MKHETGLTLKRKNMDPPTGWVFICSDGLRIQEGHLDKLKASVIKHYRVNELEEPEDWDAVIQHQICLHNPESLCNGTGPKRFFPSPEQIVKGTQAIITVIVKRMLKKNPFVLPEEAERRAEICISCPHNINYVQCFLCSTLYKTIVNAFKRKTTVDGYLKVCGVCACMNQAQVHLKAEEIRKLTSKETIQDYPETNCWKRELLEKKDG